MSVRIELYPAARPLRKPGPQAPLFRIRDRAIAQRKFLLFRDGGDLVVLIGPSFAGLADYHHDELQFAAAVCGLRKSAWRVGGGVLYIVGNARTGWDVMFELWSDAICGPYDGSLGDEAAVEDIAAELGMKIRVDESGATKRPY